jgi:hypothetical protein
MGRPARAGDGLAPGLAAGYATRRCRRLAKSANTA